MDAGADPAALKKTFLPGAVSPVFYRDGPDPGDFGLIPEFVVF